eukprot:661640_1
MAAKQNKSSTEPWVRRAKTMHLFNSNIILLENNSFLIAPYNYKHQKSKGISLYDVKKNKWSTFIPWTSADLITSYHTMYHDKDTNTLYLYGEESHMITIDLNTYKCAPTLDFSKKCSVGRKPELFQYGSNSKFHILLGGSSANDYIWNQKRNEFKLKHSFSFTQGLGGRGLVHIPSDNGPGRLLMFGGYDKGKRRSFKCVWECKDPKKCKWIELKQPQLPRTMADFAYVVTFDYRFIIILGGRGGAGKSNNILIWNLQSMKIKPSKIRCPVAGMFNAVLTKTNDIHIINKENGKHYKIALNHIIKSDEYEEKEQIAKTYNEDVVKQLVQLQLGNRDECIKASGMVVDYNDINVVADKLREISDGTAPVIQAVGSVGSMENFVGSIGLLLGIIQKKMQFMDDHNAVVDKLIAASKHNVELLKKAKVKALETEKEILEEIMNISSMNTFLNNIILIENLFNSMYTEEERQKQKQSRSEHAPNIQIYEKKKKPRSQVQSFVELLFAGTNLEIGSLKKWLKKVDDECKKRRIKMVSNSGAKAKNIERAFYKAFYVYARDKNESEGFKEMTDILRCSLVFDDFDDLYRCFTVIEELAKENDNGGILRCKDRFAGEKVPFGYRDLLINIYCPGSKIVCEIQLQHQMFYKYKKISHIMYKKARLFEENDVNLAYAYADEHVRKTIGDQIYELEQEEEENDDEKKTEEMDPYDMMKQWGLQQYAERFIDEEGFDDVSMWIDVTVEDLKEYGFKTGHAKKFLKKVQEL